MAESGGEKTEAPTPKRREEAREQGNIPRSPDLNSAVLLIGALFLMKWFGTGVIMALRQNLETMLSPAFLGDPSFTGVASRVLQSIGLVAAAVAPLMVGLMFFAVAINIAQVGLNFNTNRLTPNLSALNPAQGISNLMSRGQAVVQLLMNLLKIVLVALVAYSAVKGRIAQIIGIQHLSFLQIFALASQLIYSIGLRLAFLLLVLAIGDYFYHRYKVEQSMKMSKQEVKEEMRRLEGDPVIKSRRRQLAVQRHLKQLKKDVPKADVVITNPTHFAVAIQYEEGKMRAPKVVAKGVDYIALRIRELAVEAGIPIVERPSLARAIYRLVDVGREIPEQFYSSMAEILAYVYELSRRARVRAFAR